MDDWSVRHPVAAALEAMPPGARLASALSGVDPTEADGAALVEAVAACERMISWATALQACAVAEMTRRTTSSRELEFVGDEVASRLGTTRRSADLKVELAAGLDRSPAVLAALVDVRKATVLTGETAHLAPADATAIHERLLPDAPDLTGPQLRVAIRRAELTLDPEAARKSHERARADRSVTIAPAPCSMAWLTAYLPADDAMVVMTAVDALAGSKGADDDRGIDARRADALVAVMTQVLNSGVGPDGPLPVRQHRRPHLQVTAAATTLVGLDQAPAVLAGYGPIPAEMARRIGADATWRPMLTDHRTGELLARSSTTYRPRPALAGLVVDRDVTCTFPGCRVAAVQCDVDHIVPFDARRPAAAQTHPDNLQALCRHHHRLKTLGRWTASRDPRTGSTRWTSPTGHVYARDPVPTDPTAPFDRSRSDGPNQVKRPDGLHGEDDPDR